MKKGVFLATALLIALMAALPAAAMDEIYYWPLAGTVKGTNVNVRGGPGTSFKAVGKISGGEGAAPIPVTGIADTGEKYPWYRVESRSFGQGWIYGQFISAEEAKTPLMRHALRINADFGLTPSLAVKKLGKPEKQENEKFHIPDFRLTVAVTTLFYSGFKTVYWDGGLKSVIISGGEASFGDITPGMAAEAAQSMLGEPAGRDGKDLLYYGSDSEEYLSRDEIILRIAPGSSGDQVAGLEYQFAVFE